MGEKQKPSKQDIFNEIKTNIQQLIQMRIELNNTDEGTRLIKELGELEFTACECNRNLCNFIRKDDDTIIQIMTSENDHDLNGIEF